MLEEHYSKEETLSSLVISDKLNSKDELTYKVPQKDAFLEQTSRAESMVEELLQSSHQTALSTQQDRQTPSLTARREKMSPSP